jgi:predicted amidohydrolase
MLATAAFPVFAPRAWSEVEDVLARWVADAHAAGARLLVFPEYGAMSVAALFEPAVQADLHGQLQALQERREDWLALHRQLAAAHRVAILAGSFPWQLEDGSFRNRAWFCADDGDCEYQDKRVMTRFEREVWGVAGVDRAPVPLKVFDTALGRIGINLCYDAEFPLHARAQTEAGAELILVPSCTDAAAGWHRVRVAAAARALENQCYVAVSPLVGEAPWSPAVDVNVGAAGVYGPPDRGFPEDGVIAQGPVNEPGWVYAQIDLAKVAEVRLNGQVLNRRDWPESGHLPIAELTSL